MDSLVIGAGPGGLGVAGALRQRGARALVIERVLALAQNVWTLPNSPTGSAQKT